MRRTPGKTAVNIRQVRSPRFVKVPAFVFPALTHCSSLSASLVCLAGGQAPPVRSPSVETVPALLQLRCRPYAPLPLRFASVLPGLKVIFDLSDLRIGGGRCFFSHSLLMLAFLYHVLRAWLHLFAAFVSPPLTECYAVQASSLMLLPWASIKGLHRCSSWRHLCVWWPWQQRWLRMPRMMAGGPSGASVEEAATARIQATSKGCPVPIPPKLSPSLFHTFRGW